MVEERRPGCLDNLTGAIRSIGERVGVVETKEDKIWEDFMRKKRGLQEMVALLGEGFKPEFERRILQVFFVPNFRQLPFPINVDTPSTNCLGMDIDWRRRLTPSQAIDAAELLNLYIPQVKGGMDDHSKEARWEYNQLILKLLPVLPEEMAEKLFTHFNLNDIEPFLDIESASGYNPLKGLYNDVVIDEGWKRKAAVRMHETILREEAGESKPREIHEAAAECYRLILDLMLYGDGKLPVSLEFYQEEVAFLLANTKEPVIESWNTGKAMDLLTDPELKHQFVRRQVLYLSPESGERDFSVYDQNTMEIAERILKEYPQDPELQAYLGPQVSQYQSRLAEERKQCEEANTKEEFILAHMRK